MNNELNITLTTAVKKNIYLFACKKIDYIIYLSH